MRALFPWCLALLTACGNGAVPFEIEPSTGLPRGAPLPELDGWFVAPTAPPLVQVPYEPLPTVAFDPHISAAPCATTTITQHPDEAVHMAQVDSISIDVSLGRGCRAEKISIELVSPQNSVFEVRSFDLRGGKEAHFSFPVAGSVIEQRRLGGSWQVRAFVDGDAAAPSFFYLNR